MQGDKHPATLQTMNNLANTYKMEGRYLDAELLYVDCLMKMKTTMGENHPDTLQTMNNLANTYSRQDKHTEAEEVYRSCYEKMRAILGESLFLFIVDAGIHGWLAQLLSNNTIPGIRHPDTVRTALNLSSTYCSRGMYSEAEMIMVESRREMKGR